MACARHSHVQGVELFAFACQLLGGKRLSSALWRMAFTDQKDEFLGRNRFTRPVHQHAHAVYCALRSVRVKQQHSMGLQPFGTVNRQQPHSMGVDRRRGLQATGLQSPHKGVRRGVAATVKLQGHTQQRLQIGQHGAS